MVTSLLILLLLLATLTVSATLAVYSRRRRLRNISQQQTSRRPLPPPPGGWRGAFVEDAGAVTLIEASRRRADFLARAGAGEMNVLSEIRNGGDASCYDEALGALVERANASRTLAELTRHLEENRLRGNSDLAEKYAVRWAEKRDKASTAAWLHAAALADDAALYQTVMERTVAAHRAGDLPDISSEQLSALIEGEYWVLSSGARSSGAGFTLKQALVSARRGAAQNSSRRNL